MNRRSLLTLLGGAAAWPVVARGQTIRMRRVGAVMAWSANDLAAQARAGVFQDELRALGWEEGRNLQIEYRWGGVTRDIVSAHTNELIALVPDVIVTSSTTAAQLLRGSPRSMPSV